MENSKYIKRNLGRYIGTSYRMLYKGFNAFLRERNIGLTAEQFVIMKRLRENEGCTQQQLAAFTHKNKASITFLLNNLCRQDLLVRIPDKEDKRKNLIYLTQGGKKLQEETNLLLIEFMEKITENIPEENLRISFDVLEKLIENLDCEKEE